MNALEISILVLAAAPVLYRAWSGWRNGAATEIRYLLVNFFGVLVAIRYWQPWSEAVSSGLTFDPRWIALSSFVVLYGLGTLVAGFVVNLKGKTYQSVKSNLADKWLGGLVGIGAGLLLAAGVLWLAQVAKLGRFETIPVARNASETLREGMRAVEATVGVAPDSTGRTRYPHVTVVEVPVDVSEDVASGGVVLLQQRGKIAWLP